MRRRGRDAPRRISQKLIDLVYGPVEPPPPPSVREGDKFVVRHTDDIPEEWCDASSKEAGPQYLGLSTGRYYIIRPG